MKDITDKFEKKNNIFQNRIFLIIISKVFGFGSILLFFLNEYNYPSNEFAAALSIVTSTYSMSYWFNEFNWHLYMDFQKVATFKMINSLAITFLIITYVSEYFLNYFIRKRKIKLIFLKLIVLCFIVNKFIVSYTNPFWFFSSFLILCFVIDTIHFLYYKYSSKN